MQGVCPKCGSTVTMDSKFCPKCGASLAGMKEAAQQEKRVCKQCGNEVEQDAQFCPYCGQPVGVQEAAAASPGKAGNTAAAADDGEKISWETLLDYKGRMDQQTYMKQILISYGVAIVITFLLEVLTDYPVLLRVTALIIGAAVLWGNHHYKGTTFHTISAVVVVIIGISAILHRMHLIHNSSADVLGIAVILILSIAELAIVAYQILLVIKRCHDLDYSGWLALLALVPFASVVFEIYLACVPGKKQLKS